MKPKFPLGQTVITRNALNTLTQEDVTKALASHVSGDWGDVCPEDAKENELALEKGFRLLSAYHAYDDAKFWVITEPDRSTTMVLLPEDY